MRRGLVVAVGVLVVLGGIAGLALVFSARDEPELASPAGGSAGPGELQPDRGAEHSGPAAPLAAANLPTSGPHEPQGIDRDARDLTADQILHALELGNVVFVYGEPKPPQGLLDLQEAVAGPFDSELASSGLAVVLARVPGVDEVTALAWRRQLVTRGADAPELREFAEAWLGKGAPGVRE